MGRVDWECRASRDSIYRSLDGKIRLFRSETIFLTVVF